MKVIVLLLIVILFLILAVKKVYDRKLRQHLETKEAKKKLELVKKLEEEQKTELPAVITPTPVSDGYFPLIVEGEYLDTYGTTDREGIHTVSLVTHGGLTLIPGQIKSPIEHTLLASIRSKLLTGNVKVSISGLKEGDPPIKINSILYRGGQIASQNSHIVTSSSCWDPDFLVTKLSKVTLILTL